MTLGIHSDGAVAVGMPASGPQRHAVAALCLYQQAFGFVAADVSRLLAGDKGYQDKENRRVWRRGDGSEAAPL